MSRPPFPNMDELLQRLLDDQIEPDEFERLQKAIREDPRVRDYYVDSMLACAVIRRSSQATGELSESDLIQALVGDESQGGSKRITRHLYWVAAILMLGALILGSLSIFRHKDKGPVIGRLTGVYEAQWQGANPHLDESLYAGPYELCEGVAEIELGRGTKLLLEAPSHVELTSGSEVVLRRGRLVAEVSPQASGFKVRTLTAVITDLGTEFGVVVYPDGSTDAHVLKGSISIALDPNIASNPMSVVVRQGQSATVDPAGQTIRGIPATIPDAFVRQLPPASRHSSQSERLNLADIVGGGNGRGSGILDSGIDLGTGEAYGQPATVIRRARQNEFLVTPQFRGVDGVFVPNGALGPVVISSTGLTFSECPDTLGSYYGGPANSGKIYDIPSEQIYTARLNGVSLGTSRHPALNLHPNAGITFDLDQIRQDNPNVQFGRFTAVCGVPRDLPRTQFSPATVWLLLDGTVSGYLRYPTVQSIVREVDVPIPAQARFLTLVTTCSGPADYSWIFFGDPYLEPAAGLQVESRQ